MVNFHQKIKDLMPWSSKRIQDELLLTNLLLSFPDTMNLNFIQQMLGINGNNGNPPFTLFGKNDWK